MVYVNKTKKIEITEWEQIIRELNLDQKLEQAKTILIKPNFAAGTYAKPETHVMSDLALLASAVEYFSYANPKAKILIAEADSTGYGFAYLKFEHLGLPESLHLSATAASQVELLDMTRDKLQRVQMSEFMRYTTVDKQLWLSEQLMNADFKVSLSNLKMHAVTGYTGACKNLFGCLPDFDKSQNHPHIDKVIHDLVMAINPDLSIVDAFYGMEKNGPVQGIDIDSGYRVFSNNAIEADFYAAETVGYDPMKVGYLKKLKKTCQLVIAEKAEIIQRYQKPGTFLRVMNAIGVFIQKCGQGIANFGHKIHSCPTPLILGVTIIRPILLKCVDYDKLKALSRKYMK